MPEKISPELAKAIGQVLHAWDDDKEAAIKDILTVHQKDEHGNDEVISVLQSYPVIKIIKAIVNGFEVETPEEKLAAYYKGLDIHGTQGDHLVGEGIVTALSILGIKIKGVND